MSEPRTLLAIDRVSKNFGRVTAVDGISLDIRENEFFALLGPSGCGKTTLLRMLAGFETPNDGRILLDGRDITALKQAEAQLVAAKDQDANIAGRLRPEQAEALLDVLSTRENR